MHTQLGQGSPERNAYLEAAEMDWRDATEREWLAVAVTMWHASSASRRSERVLGELMARAQTHPELIDALGHALYSQAVSAHDTLGVHLQELDQARRRLEVASGQAALHSTGHK